MSDDNDVHITSINQSGGITAGTVNIGNPTRTITDQNKAFLQEHLPKDAPVTVVCTMGDGEAHSFANDILNWLQANGYSNAKGVDQAVWSQPVIGIGLVPKPEDSFEIQVGTNQKLNC